MANKVIKGYQYGDGNVFIGTYVFEDNLDKEETHLPPRTTLIAPPSVPVGHEAVWDGFNWFTRPMDITWLNIDGTKSIHPLTPEIKEIMEKRIKELHPTKPDPDQLERP
jgi:hypothetical protein